MDYVSFLVERNRNKSVNELVQWYLESEDLKCGSCGEKLLSNTIKTAIEWILCTKPIEYKARYTKIKRGLRL